MVYFEEIIVLMPGKFCGGQNLVVSAPNLAIFGHFGPILTIKMLFGLFMQNDVVSEQYFSYGKTDNILF